MRILTAALLVLMLAGPAQASETLPPVSGPEEPRVIPRKNEDGIYSQDWFVTSFLNLREDHAEATAAGKRLAVIFEQRGCIYCTKMHTEVLALKYINDYVRQNFNVVQLDLWGSREVTDFDGATMPEKKLAERWGVLFTPTVVFFKDELSADRSQWGSGLEVARMHLGMGPGTFYDMFVWIRTKTYEKDRNFQRFHIERHQQR